MNWLNKQKEAGFYQRGQDWLERLSRQTNDWASFEKKARDLAAEPAPPPLQYCLGRILYGHDQSREGVQMMMSAYSRWPKNGYPPAPYVGDGVLRVLLKQGDLKPAEVIANGLLEEPSCGSNPQWLGDVAVKAAGHGAADLAMRLWERKASLDLVDQKGLEALAAAGLRERLIQFYSDLSKKAPDNKSIEAALVNLKK